MESPTRSGITALTELVPQHLDRARHADSGRSAETVHGGHDCVLRQTVIALLAGRTLHEHENPGEATLQVLHGQVRLLEGAQAVELTSGQLAAIPPARHSLVADTDAVVLLTVAKVR